MLKLKYFTLALCGLGLILTGCKSEADEAYSGKNGAAKEARAILKPTQGNNVQGVITFTMVDSSVRIVGDLQGLTPGLHGFHIHEKGDCSSPDAKSAGEHFDPYHKQHAGPDQEERHVGDLGNVMADENGNAHYERIDKVISLIGDNSIIGKSVIVHAKKDDFHTQPSGDAGDRVACGVIEVVEEE